MKKGKLILWDIENIAFRYLNNFLGEINIKEDCLIITLDKFTYHNMNNLTPQRKKEIRNKLSCRQVKIYICPAGKDAADKELIKQFKRYKFQFKNVLLLTGDKELQAKIKKNKNNNQKIRIMEQWNGGLYYLKGI